MYRLVKSLSAVILNINTHGMPLVQSNDSVGTNCFTICTIKSA